MSPWAFKCVGRDSRGALCNASGIPDGGGVRGGVSPRGEGARRGFWPHCGNPGIGKTHALFYCDWIKGCGWDGENRACVLVGEKGPVCGLSICGVRRYGPGTGIWIRGCAGVERPREGSVLSVRAEAQRMRKTRQESTPGIRERREGKVRSNRIGVLLMAYCKIWLDFF